MPEAKDGDAWLLRFILHDWSDEKCIRILHNCRRCMEQSKSSQLIIVEVCEVSFAACRLAIIAVLQQGTLMATAFAGQATAHSHAVCKAFFTGSRTVYPLTAGVLCLAASDSAGMGLGHGAELWHFRHQHDGICQWCRAISITMGGAAGPGRLQADLHHTYLFPFLHHRGHPWLMSSSHILLASSLLCKEDHKGMQI